MPCSWEGELVQPLRKMLRRHLKQLKQNSCVAQQSRFWAYPQKQSRDGSRHRSTHVHRSIIHNTQTVEANRGPVAGQVDKHNAMHVYY